MKILDRYREFREIEREYREVLKRLFDREEVNEEHFHYCNESYNWIKYRIKKGL